ncbi:MAG: dipeptide epimerase [Alphaproteobacteria bacterium]|nr:dipeptide epimerase [Alphaproteobacteria bacterium]
MREPFVISRGAQLDQGAVIVEIEDKAGRLGRGEGCGVPYAGETPATMLAQIEAVRSDISASVTRAELQRLLPAGGARCAVDAALWDLEAKQAGKPAWALAGLSGQRPVHTAFTIGMRSLEAYAETARRHADYKFLKVKVDHQDPIAAIEAVRRGAQRSTLIVDPNQSWSVAMLRELAPRLAELGVGLLEQPVRVGDEAELDGFEGPPELCADELINQVDDLANARGRFGVINIKLDKCGGLTTALALADAAEAAGFRLMVGCMAGSSLSMAPAMLLAQRCAYVDLDGPLLQAEDWPGGIAYQSGLMMPPGPEFWG